MKKLFTVVAVASLIFTSCQKQSQEEVTAQDGQETVKLTESMVSEQGQNPDDQFNSSASQRPSRRSFVYLESNDAAWNTIIIYEQLSNGKLNWIGQANSGGKGAGQGLGSAGAVALDKRNDLLFAVNAGSNSVSSFKIESDGKLLLLSTESSHGERPLSVTVNGQYVYVVNGVSADVFGYRVRGNGKLDPIEGSSKKLSSSDATPAQIAFTPSGNTLLVTEKGTNKITAFSVNANGSIGNRVVNTSIGTTPFGFDFARGQYLIVTNADGGTVGTSSCTSYKTLDNLNIKATNGMVPNGQSAVCWVAATTHGRYVFTANTGSNTLTAYFVDGSGKIYFIPWATEKTGDKPADIIVSNDNEYVYNINGGTNTLGEYKRTALGGLKNIGYVNAVPDFAAGLVSY